MRDVTMDSLSIPPEKSNGEESLFESMLILSLCGRKRKQKKCLKALCH